MKSDDKKHLYKIDRFGEALINKIANDIEKHFVIVKLMYLATASISILKHLK